MKCILMILCLLMPATKVYSTPWSESYQYFLIQKASQQMANLSSYSTLRYPNDDFEDLAARFPDQKILIFGYGSLMNKLSAARSISRESIQTMRPVVAFGLKRLFNYHPVSLERWGPDLHPREKAMLNVMPVTTYKTIINGVALEASIEDVRGLIKRERGYDLVPILIADWNSVSKESPDVVVKVAYTFLVPEEIRCGIAYIQQKYYPVKGYLKMVREGAAAFGSDFLVYFDNTTFLANGVTAINEWDEHFKDKLCNDETIP
jgi:hypothetical protein